MDARYKIIFEVLKEEYPHIPKDALGTFAEYIDSNWHIIKRRSLDGVNNEWTLSGHLQSVIWDTLGEGAQSAASAHKILRRMSEEKVH